MGEREQQEGWAFETRAVHTGQEPDPTTGAVVVPISLATTLIPTVLLVLSILASRSYDLTAKRHAEIVAALKARGHVSR